MWLYCEVVVEIALLIHSVTFLCLTVNLGNARIAGLEHDLKMNTKSYDYNFLVMAFFLPYLLSEFPSVILCKWIGPGWWLPFCTSAFGVTTLCFSLVRSLHGAIVNRVFLAVFEACMLPGFIYYLSRWYRRSEIALRLAFFMCSASFSGAFGGLLASAILRRESIGSLKGWEMIFFVEGLITLLIGLVSFALLTDRIETARWLSAEEKALATSRLTSERVSTDVVLDRLRSQQVLKGALSLPTLAVALHYGICSITIQSFGFMLPSIVKIDFPGCFRHGK